jgi:chromosome segregation ATPase
LAKDPADRYQNGKELHLAVTKALEKQARFEHKTLIDKELATSKAQQIEEHERSKQSYRKQITKLETELDKLQNQKTKATNDTTEKYQTQITTLEIKIEDLNKRLDRKTNDFTNANNLLTASEQINQGLTTKAQTFENQIATLNQTIANLKNRPVTEKVVEKIVTVTVLPEAAKKEIEKVKSRTLGQLVGIGAIAALLGGGVGWNVGKPEKVAEKAAVNPAYIAVDSAVAPVDSTAYPTLAACEETLKYYEVQENLGGQKKPLEQNTIDQILLIVQAYPQLKDRAYQIYYNEGMRLKPIDEPSSRPYFKVAKEIEAL